jgi:hypothetical protein
VIVRPVRIAFGALALALALVAGCSSGKPAKVVTVTKTPPPTTTTPTTSAAATSPSATPTPTATRQTKISGTCDTLLPDSAVFAAIGVPSLTGSDAFVVGKPEPSISRIAYLNCRYGVTGKGATATPAIEIGISLYATEAKASDRVSATVDDYTAHGAAASDVTVGGTAATMLTGGIGDDYAVPLLVVASGQRTVAVSVARAVATGDKAVKDATALAALALARTAH